MFNTFYMAIRIFECHFGSFMSKCTSPVQKKTFTVAAYLHYYKSDLSYLWSRFFHTQNATSAYKTSSFVFLLSSSELLHPKSWEWLSLAFRSPFSPLWCSLFLLDSLLALLSPTFLFSIAPWLTLSFYFRWTAARWDNIPMALLTGETPQLTSIRDNWKPRQWDCQLECH